jgi:hypothetical protein
MRLSIVIAAVVVVVVIGYTVKTTMFPSSIAASLLMVAAPTATMLSPHEIHLNYTGMKDLPVHDSTNAN